MISPPPGAFHTPIDPSRIIIAGDSSGAGLAAALLLLLLTLPRIGASQLLFHDSLVTINTPPVGGLALASPYLDIARSLPSVYRNARFDILKPPTIDPESPTATPDFPPDEVWPVDPPRVETYCEASMVTHPLVSPLAATSEMWRGTPPVFVCLGWEGTQDEAEVFCRRVYEAGSPVVFEGYEGMPHIFALVPWNHAGRTAAKHWAEFCSQAVRDGGVPRRDWGTWMDKSGRLRRVLLETLGMRDARSGDGGFLRRDVDLDDTTVEALMTQERAWRVDAEEALRRKWTTG